LLADLSDVDVVLTEEKEVGRRRDLNTVDGQSMVSSGMRGSRRGTDRDFVVG
jgi:hypothetical protein